MIKKILTYILMFIFAFSAAACGQEENEFIEYTLTQTLVSTKVDYDGRKLKATVVEFAQAETPEKVESIFGKTETGKTDVAYLGRVQIIDGNVVIGLRVGDKPRMAGIFVKGFGYYFIDAKSVRAGDYAVCLKNVPHGTFQMSTFSIVEDDFLVGDDFKSFTKEQALLLEGETENDFTVEVGKLVLDGEKYQSIADESFAVAKDSVFNVGKITAMVKGDAGVTLGVYGSTTGDISKASYIYAGIKDGKATLIEYQVGEPIVLSETAIENYDMTAEYAIGVDLQAVSEDDEPRQTKLVLSVNGNDVATVDKLVDENRNAGFMCLSNGSSVSAVNIPPCTLEEYKAYAKAQFDNLITVEFYVERITGLTTSYIETETKTYNDPAQHPFVAREYNKAIKAMETATDIANATTLYKKYSETLTAEVLETYKEDIESSLKAMAENWYSILNFSPSVQDFPKQDQNEDGNPDVTVYYLNGVSEPFNRGLDGIDQYTWDYRWWVPYPLRLPNILTNAHKELAKCNSKDVLKIMYEEYYEAALRSVCQKMVEEVHAIKYKEEDGFLWAYCWNYCGDTEGKLATFVYDGPVTDYKGMEYGVSNETQFRLSPLVYKPGECGEGIFGDRGMVALFNYAMASL